MARHIVADIHNTTRKSIMTTTNAGYVKTQKPQRNVNSDKHQSKDKKWTRNTTKRDVVKEN